MGAIQTSNIKTHLNESLKQIKGDTVTLIKNGIISEEILTIKEKNIKSAKVIQAREKNIRFLKKRKKFTDLLSLKELNNTKFYFKQQIKLLII